MLNLMLLTSEGASDFNPFDPSAGGGLLWTWIIFLVALVPMWKVVMRPIVRGLEERDARALEAIASAERAARDAVAAQAAVEQRLAEARTEAASMVETARARAEARERDILAQAKHESEALLARARAEIRSEQDKAVAAIRKQVVDLSLHAAGQVLRRRVDAQDDRRLVEELVTNAGAEVKA